jgi:hypothetical protein
LQTVVDIFSSCDLRVFDVQILPTHGGSLRVFGCHADDSRLDSVAVATILEQEIARGLRRLETYTGFQTRANRIKDDVLEFLITQKKAGRKVVAYGAAAKGNTLLNYAGIRPDLLPFVCDAAVAKQGKFMPGSHLPILPPEALLNARPDFVLVLPWNIAAEVRSQLSYLAEQGCKFVTAVPHLKII